MGYDKTGFLEDKFDALMCWARSVRRRIWLRDRGSLLIKEEEDKKDEEKNETDIHNN